jgi:hypothetical protein
MAKSRGRATARGQEGASLILAMIFMSVVSLITLAMAAWATTGLHSTLSFTEAQSTVSTANSTAEVALQEVRTTFYSNTLWAQPPVSCWPGGVTPPALQDLNNQSMNAFCFTHWPFSGSASHRQVTIYVCPTTFSAAQCGLTPYLQVIVTFDDRPATGGFATCNPESTTATDQWTTCGTYMTINSWVFATIPPTLVSIQIPGSILSPCTTKNFTLTGTGFIAGSTKVYFESSVTVNGSTILTSLQGTVSSTNASGTILTGCVPNNSPSTASVIVATPIGQSSNPVSVSY